MPDQGRRPNDASITLTYDQRCALLWAIEELLLVNDPESVPEDFPLDQVGILLRQARKVLREATDGVSYG